MVSDGIGALFIQVVEYFYFRSHEMILLKQVSQGYLLPVQFGWLVLEYFRWNDFEVEMEAVGAW